MIAALRRHWPMLLMWLAASALLVWFSWDHILTREGWDPDDQLRMVQLRDFLGGQSWFDTTQYRMNAPDGAPMHWSRLIELPLAVLILIFTPLLGAAGAEMLAGTLVPLLSLGGIAALLAGVGTKIGGRAVGILAFWLALIAPALLLQLRPMRIDHHGWQIFCAVLGFATLYWQDRRNAGLVLGAALAVWAHISLEGMPMTAAFFLFLGWQWAMGTEDGKERSQQVSALRNIAIRCLRRISGRSWGLLRYSCQHAVLLRLHAQRVLLCAVSQGWLHWQSCYGFCRIARKAPLAIWIPLFANIGMPMSAKAYRSGIRTGALRPHSWLRCWLRCWAWLHSGVLADEIRSTAWAQLLIS
jgi:hypothetical protein